MPDRRGFSFSDTRHYLPYFLMLVIFVGGVWLVLHYGSQFDSGNAIANQAVKALPSAARILWENLRTSVGILLTQIIVILILAGLFRRLFRAIPQPPVMGEIIAGIVLGPS